jgi:hypothetical protein
MQNANAAYQLTQLIGSQSGTPGAQVRNVASHRRPASSAAAVGANELVQLVLQPLPLTFGFAPAFDAGLPAASQASYALTKFRKRPVVTSYLSSRNSAQPH